MRLPLEHVSKQLRTLSDNEVDGHFQLGLVERAWCEYGGPNFALGILEQSCGYYPHQPRSLPIALQSGPTIAMFQEQGDPPKCVN